MADAVGVVGCFADGVFWACGRLAPAAGEGAELVLATEMRRAAEQRIGTRGKGAMVPRGARSVLATEMRRSPGSTPRTVYRITPLSCGAMPCEMRL